MAERVLSFGDALSRVLAEARQVRAHERERVALEHALGRVLADDVHADRDQPPFDRSTRDGFAVRAADGTQARRMVGTLRAGEDWSGGPLGRAEAIEIMTGAALPAGADAVVMLEHVTTASGMLSLAEGRTVAPNLNVVRQGSEASAGAPVLRAGSRIGPAEMAVAASCGCAELSMWARPKVAVVATGDELVELGGDRRPAAHEIWNSNAPALRAAVTAEGGWAGRIPSARDHRDDLRERIAQGSMWDLLVLSGGVSTGKYDLVEDVLREFDAEFFFTGVAMTPGKPLVFGRLPKRGEFFTGVTDEERAELHAARAPWTGAWTYFFGLPGNPVSTQVTFAVFVAPFVRALAGQRDIAPQFVLASLSEAIEGSSARTRLLPAELTGDWNEVLVRPVSWQGSGDVAANVRGNAYVVLPAGVERWAAGETVRVLLR